MEMMMQDHMSASGLTEKDKVDAIRKKPSTMTHDGSLLEYQETNVEVQLNDDARLQLSDKSSREKVRATGPLT